MYFLWHWCYYYLPNYPHRTDECGSNHDVEDDLWVDKESNVEPLDDGEEFRGGMKDGDEGVEDGVGEEEEVEDGVDVELLDDVGHGSGDDGEVIWPLDHGKWEKSLKWIWDLKKVRVK